MDTFRNCQFFAAQVVIQVPGTGMLGVGFDSGKKLMPPPKGNRFSKSPRDFSGQRRFMLVDFGCECHRNVQPTVDG